MPRVAIPGGVWRNDSQRTAEPLREVALRPAGGEDEAFLIDSADQATPSERATGLLVRCVEEPDADRLVRSLTIGDREALLLHLRRITLGDTLDCVLSCPANCGERMEFELRVDDLLVPAYRDVHAEYDVTLEAEGRRYDVTFRLPIAADLDRAAPIARSDALRGARTLLECCVVRAARDEGVATPDELPLPVQEAIAKAMAKRDPQAEIELDLACPQCGTAFAIVFDTAAFLLQELDERAAHLAQEVHTLAWHYHWSEREILGMPRRRRTRYLELVADALARARAP